MPGTGYMNDDELTARIIRDYRGKELPSVNALVRKYRVGRQRISRVLPDVTAARSREHLAAVEEKTDSHQMSGPEENSMTPATYVQTLFNSVQDLIIQSMDSLRKEAGKQFEHGNTKEYESLLEKIRVLASAFLLLYDKDSSEKNDYESILRKYEEGEDQFSTILAQMYMNKEQFYELIHNARVYKLKAESVPFLEKIISDNQNIISELETQNASFRSVMNENTSLKNELECQKIEMQRLQEQHNEEIQVLRKVNNEGYEEYMEKLDRANSTIENLKRTNNELRSKIDILVSRR